MPSTLHLYVHETCIYVPIRSRRGETPPVQTGWYFCPYCTYLHVYTCLYIHIRAITCKNMTPLNRGFSALCESKSKYWHVSYRYFFYIMIFICNSYVVACIEKKNTFTPYLYVFWWFQRLISKAACVLYTETLRNVCTSTYYYVCLRPYMDYVLVRTYTNICTYIVCQRALH